MKLVDAQWLFALGLTVFGVGCVDQTSGDMALAEVRRVQAENQASANRIVAIEQRQIYLAQQMSILYGVLDTLSKENATRAEDADKRADEELARIERLEKIEVARRERERNEAPASIVSQAQALLDAGRVKVTNKNGRARLDLLDSAGMPVEVIPHKRPAVASELEDPWAAPRKSVFKKSRRVSDDLGF